MTAIEPLLLNQTLHGYRDGHRLLASSLELDRRSSSKMLEMSDLMEAPTRGADDRYFSGYPLPGARAYVIAATWAAPEIARPGAAWTHSLLLSYDDIPSVESIAGIWKMFRRPPADPEKFPEYYKRVLSWDGTRQNDPDGKNTWMPTAAVIEALYGTERPVVVQVEADEMVEGQVGVLRVWSQQWPSLRRAFSFRTLGRAGDAATFDLTLVPSRGRETSGGNVETVVGHMRAEWVSRLAGDLAERNPGMHRFLARYGSDAAKPRTSFPSLVRSWLWLEGLSPDLGWLGDLLSRQGNDMANLRGDIMSLEVFSDFGRSELWPNLLAEIASLRPGAPAPTFDPGHLTVAGTMPADTVAAMLDQASGLQADSLAGYAVRTMLRGCPPETILDAVGDSLTRIRTACDACPGLVLQSETWNRQGLPRWLIREAQVSPENNGRVIDLALASGADIAADTIRRFGREAIGRWLASYADGRRKGPFRDDRWLAAAAGDPRSLLDEIKQANFLPVGLLAASCDAITLASPGPASDGEAWNCATRHLRSDEVERHPNLRAWLFKCALAASNPIAEDLFAKTFQSMHDSLAIEASPMFPFSLVFQIQRGWEWDRCRSLRTSMARAFVRNGLDPHQLKRIVRDKDTLSKVIEAIRDEPDGGDYLYRRSDR